MLYSWSNSKIIFIWSSNALWETVQESHVPEMEACNLGALCKLQLWPGWGHSIFRDWYKRPITICTSWEFPCKIIYNIILVQFPAMNLQIISPSWDKYSFLNLNLHVLPHFSNHNIYNLLYILYNNVTHVVHSETIQQYVFCSFHGWKCPSRYSVMEYRVSGPQCSPQTQGK